MNRWQQVLSHGLQQQGKLNPQQLKVLSHLMTCKTEQAGSETYACQHCGYQETIARSCRDRHCPGCQYRATLQWCEARRADILPVTYFHLVFTLPSSLNGWVSCHAAVIYRLLFESMWHTLNTFGQSPKRLNGQLGVLAVLHTWGQTLVRHVHLHCLIPGGAFGDDGRWHAVKGNYLFPVKALSRHYRGHMISALRKAHNLGMLDAIPANMVDARLTELMKTKWVVYAKPATYGHDKLIDYLGRYTRKIAISLSRIRQFDGEQVRLSYHDYRDNRQKILPLSCAELVRRFALHVLPKGFMRVRYYGFLANPIRREKLKQIRAALMIPEPAKALDEVETTHICPQCGERNWIFLGMVIRWHWHPG
ncbi:IS91 family transposase [Neptunomonas sp.]|uniref:IS91 family transposase n=1 Tax=Neptunomonas sp. TaxID=1971898 RepID=UPI00356465D8